MGRTPAASSIYADVDSWCVVVRRRPPPPALIFIRLGGLCEEFKRATGAQNSRRSRESQRVGRLGRVQCAVRAGLRVVCSWKLELRSLPEWAKPRARDREWRAPASRQCRPGRANDTTLRLHPPLRLLFTAGQWLLNTNHPTCRPLHWTTIFAL